MASLPGWWPFVAWPLAGTGVGVTLGLALTAPGRSAADVLIPLGGFFLVGMTILLGVRAYDRLVSRRREDAAPRVRVAHGKAKPKPTPAAGKPPSAARGGAHVQATLAFPDLTAPADDAWGVGEPLRLRVTALKGDAGVAGAAASVTLASDGARREVARGVTGAGGIVDAEVTVPTPGEATFTATVSVEDAPASTTRRVRFVRYADEVRRLVDALQEWARKSVPACRDALTAREVVTVLAEEAGGDAPGALGDALRIYEIVIYGERPADRALYVDLVTALARAEPALARLEKRPRAEEETARA